MIVANDSVIMILEDVLYCDCGCFSVSDMSCKEGSEKQLPPACCIKPFVSLPGQSGVYCASKTRSLEKGDRLKKCV